MATVHFRMVSGKGTQNNQGLGMTTEYWPQYWCRVFGVWFLQMSSFRCKVIFV